MSDAAIILLMLATFGLLVICVIMLFTRGHQRMDEIFTGVVGGVPISLSYRWRLLWFDFLGYAIICIAVLAAFAVGYVKVSDVTEAPPVSSVAYFLAALSGWSAVGLLVFVILWVYYLSALLRGAGRD